MSKACRSSDKGNNRSSQWIKSMQLQIFPLNINLLLKSKCVWGKNIKLFFPAMFIKDDLEMDM